MATFAQKQLSQIRPVTASTAAPSQSNDMPIWNEKQLRAATRAAGVALWSWNVDTDAISMDERALQLMKRRGMDQQMVFNASEGAWPQCLPLVFHEFFGDGFKRLVSFGIGCYALACWVLTEPHLGVQVFGVVARFAGFHRLKLAERYTPMLRADFVLKYP